MVDLTTEVLAVNSDFDEGRIDSATGYAIPDCDDILGVDQKTGSGNTLNASRAHLDGLFANDEKVTDDMHKGWFGVNPKQMNDDFWNGANVTIRKVDKIDDVFGVGPRIFTFYPSPQEHPVFPPILMRGSASTPQKLRSGGTKQREKPPRPQTLSHLFPIAQHEAR